MSPTKIPVDLILSKLAEDAEKAQSRAHKASEVLLDDLDTELAKTACEVVYQERFDVIRKRNVSAFSWTELDVTAPVDKKIWSRAWKIAEEVYDQRSEPRVKGALFYHSKHIRPRWSRGKRRIAKIGRHIFY